jgi:hypothetical protein
MKSKKRLSATGHLIPWFVGDLILHKNPQKTIFFSNILTVLFKNFAICIYSLNFSAAFLASCRPANCCRKALIFVFEGAVKGRFVF